MTPVRFVDGGRPDDKWVCGEAPPSAWERLRIRVFFVLYARAKGVANRLRGRGPTRFDGYRSTSLG